MSGHANGTTAAETPYLAALLQEIETDIRSARAIATDEELPDSLFDWQERSEIAARLTDALRKLKRIQQ